MDFKTILITTGILGCLGISMAWANETKEIQPVEISTEQIDLDMPEEQPSQIFESRENFEKAAEADLRKDLKKIHRAIEGAIYWLVSLQDEDGAFRVSSRIDPVLSTTLAMSSFYDVGYNEMAGKYKK